MFSHTVSVRSLLLRTTMEPPFWEKSSSCFCPLISVLAVILLLPGVAEIVTVWYSENCKSSIRLPKVLGTSEPTGAVEEYEQNAKVVCV